MRKALFHYDLCSLWYLADLEVGFRGGQFQMVLEGNSISTCTSFVSMSLERDVAITFALQPLSASGIPHALHKEM